MQAHAPAQMEMKQSSHTVAGRPGRRRIFALAKEGVRSCKWLISEPLIIPEFRRNDGRGLDDKDAGLPIVPDGAQPGPQQAIRRCQFRPFDGALQNADLMTGSEDLELKRRTAAEESE